MIIQSDNVRFYIFNTNCRAKVEVEVPNEDYYNEVCTHEDIEEIISIALKNSQIIEENFSTIKEYVSYNRYPGTDDIYEGTIDEKTLDYSDYSYDKFLDGKILQVEFKGKIFNTAVLLFRNWLPGEEHKN